jgi:hypothetical protein
MGLSNSSRGRESVDQAQRRHALCVGRAHQLIFAFLLEQDKFTYLLYSYLWLDGFRGTDVKRGMA